MKAHKRILEIRRQSRIGAHPENLWYYHEAVITDQPSVNQSKMSRNDHDRILKDDFTTYSHKDPVVPKKPYSFVVDWQLEDAF